MVNGECTALDGLTAVVQRKIVGGKKHTVTLAQTGAYGHELTESLMQRGVTHSTLDCVKPACPLAVLMETYTPRPDSVPVNVLHLAHIAGKALAQQHFKFYGEPFDATLKAGNTLIVRDTVFTQNNVGSHNPKNPPTRTHFYSQYNYRLFCQKPLAL